MQNLGNRLSLIGDFECQTLLIEAMCRLLPTYDNRKDHWSKVWFTSNRVRSLFLNINPREFELDIRKTLNYLNRNCLVPKVFSYVATSVAFGSLQLRKPSDYEFWIDFNYGSESISFYCSDMFNDDNENCPWETVSIPVDIIQSYYLKEETEMKKQILVLNLNCQCGELISAESLALESTQVTLSFWSVISLGVHLKKLLGPDNRCKNSFEMGRKISTVSEPVELEDIENQRIDFCEIMRKVSTISEPVELEDIENQCINSFEMARKVSTSPEPMELEDIQEDEIPVETTRKMSNYSTFLKGHENDNAIENTNYSLKKDEIPAKQTRKISISDELLDSFETDYATENANHLQMPAVEVKDLESSPNLQKEIFKQTTGSESKEMEVNLGLDNEIFNQITEDDIEVVELSPNSKYREISLGDLSPKNNDMLEKEVHENNEDLSIKEKEKQASDKETVKRRYETTHSIGPPESSDEDFTSQVVFSKKPRKAALKATKRNRAILEQSGSEKNSACSHISSQHIEYNSKGKSKKNTTASQKKRKVKATTINQTDTEGSSEISWYKRAQLGLFHTPPRRSYSKKNLKDSDTLEKSKKRTYSLKDRKKENSSLCNKSLNSESRRVSDIEQYDLVIEPKRKLRSRSTKTPHFKFKLTSSSKRKPPTSDLDSNNHSANDINIYGSSNKSDESAPLHQIGVSSEKRQFCDIEVMKDANFSNENKRKCIRSEDNTNFEFTNEDNVEQIYNTSYNNVDNASVASLNIFVDDYLSAENSVHEPDKLPDNRKKLIKPKISKYRETESKPKETLLEGISEETLIRMSPISSSKRVNSSTIPQTTSKVNIRNEEPTPLLSVESVNSLDSDEKSAKQIQLKKFLESLPTKSATPFSNDIPNTTKTPSDLTLRKNKNKEKHSIYDQDECIARRHSLNSFNSGNVFSQETQEKSIDLNEKPAKEKEPKYKSRAESSKRTKKLLHTPKKPQNYLDLNYDDNLKSYDGAENISLASTKEHSESGKAFSHSVLSTLAREMNSLNKKLFGTLQKYALKFSSKIAIGRQNLLTTIENMIACDSKISKKDLKSIALTCKTRRLEFQKDIKQLIQMGHTYFEVEKNNERKFRHLQKKITKKYFTHVHMAQEVAGKSIEEKILLKAKLLFKSFLKKIEFI